MRNYIRKMALTFYVSDCVAKFRKFDNEIIKELAEELSALTLILPIWYKPEEYNKGSFQKALVRMESVVGVRPNFLSAFPDNYLSVTINGKIVMNRITPLHVMALYVYCVDRVTDGRVEEKHGFDYLKMGKLLVKEDDGGN